MIKENPKDSSLHLKTHPVLSGLIQPLSEKDYEDLELSLIEYEGNAVSIPIFFIGTAHISWYIHGIEANEQDLFSRYES